MNSNQQYLMGCPSMEPQPFCSLPWCGKTGKIDAHHVVPRSQGGHDGPVVYICHECHMKHHGEGHIQFDFQDAAHVWLARDPSTLQWRTLVTYNEHADPIPAYDEDDSLAELLEMGGKVDYLIGRALIDKLKQYKGDRKALGEWLCESFDFNPKSINSYITKRISYASLEHPGIESIGITAGYRIARIVADGTPVADVMRDYTTMSKAQFDGKYGGGAKARRTCPKCGCEL